MRGDSMAKKQKANKKHVAKIIFRNYRNQEMVVKLH